ncbi:IS66 family insertion sequence element accessory protein TnpA [Rhodoferax ferrireducens]|uniref:IS66 family insertion sequence element accessory protein TnpA n=1 Tax=Rhodoferax ferrireducens TaxID=192843 RepID=UPI000E0D6938|nr:transposase [Rhodoferax ferrireducens]
MESAGKRRRLGAQGWREVVARFDAQGATVGEFCRREGVGQSSLHRWRARLASAPAVDAAVQRKPSRQPQKVAAGDFLELGALASASVSIEPRLELKIDLGGGLALHLVRS